jgi:tRNA 5-methylaminomethyl-2-thiouridine biosynthesis bifunctional protein
VLAQAPYVILASGAEAEWLAQSATLPLQAVRGQVSLLPAGAPGAVAGALCREGYLTPAYAGWHALGASYDLDRDAAERLDDHVGNLDRLARLLPGVEARFNPAHLPGRVAFRAVPPDRLPLAGPLPAESRHLPGEVTQLAQLPRQPGLYAVLGLASRGLIWAALLAERLVAELEGEPLPLEADLVEAIDPGRFRLKALRRGGG